MRFFQPVSIGVGSAAISYMIGPIKYLGSNFACALTFSLAQGLFVFMSLCIAAMFKYRYMILKSSESAVAFKFSAMYRLGLYSVFLLIGTIVWMLFLNSFIQHDDAAAIKTIENVTDFYGHCVVIADPTVRPQVFAFFASVMLFTNGAYLAIIYYGYKIYKSMQTTNSSATSSQTLLLQNRLVKVRNHYCQSSVIQLSLCR